MLSSMRGPNTAAAIGFDHGSVVLGSDLGACNGGRRWQPIFECCTCDPGATSGAVGASARPSPTARTGDGAVPGPAQ